MNPEYTKKGGFLGLQKKTFYRHDIALLETVEPIQFNDKVQPIEIAKEKPAGNSLVYAGGWGNNNVSAMLLDFVKSVMCAPTEA